MGTDQTTARVTDDDRRLYWSVPYQRPDLLFITWFPVYLVQARGMSILKAGFVASVPAVCGFIGGVLGGIISDWLMRRTGSLNIARKHRS